MNYKRPFNDRKPTISFFCPAYNDELNLPILIPKVFSLLKKVSSQFEIIIIDDASPDNSGVVADSLVKKYAPFVKAIHHKKNEGYGGAIQSGFKNACHFEYVFYTDGDNQYDVNELINMLSYIPEYDAVLGFRTNRSITLSRKIQSSVYNAVVRTLFHVDNPDVSCALRLIKRTFITKMRLHSSSAFIQSEIILKLNQQNAKIKKIPVKHYSRLHGKASGGKPKVIFDTIFDILREVSSKGD